MLNNAKFDKKRFAQILKNIEATYYSQREFSEKSKVNRTSISNYENCKLQNPPKPEVLKKLAISSNGIITYKELMYICGYVDKEINYFNKIQEFISNNDITLNDEDIDEIKAYIEMKCKLKKDKENRR